MEDTRGRWERAYVQALEYDTWGQVEEAISSYQRLQTAAATEYVENILQLPKSKREDVGRLAHCLKIRIQELEGGANEVVGIQGMNQLKRVMKSLLVEPVVFPLVFDDNKADIQALIQEMKVSHQGEMELDETGAKPVSHDGSLRPPPNDLPSGKTAVTFRVLKWGMKDARVYLEPRVAFSVHDERGKVIEPVQETPICPQRDDKYLMFGDLIHLQTPLEDLPATAAVFFELRHYKSAKKKKSCKAYCFLEIDEIKEGPLALEVYKKPSDYARKRDPHLLTIKALYLHLELTLTRHKG